MSLFSYNGGSVVAMAGKGCVAIGCDLRQGEQMQTIAVNVEKVHKISDRLYVGLCGLNTDCITVRDKMLLRKNLYELRENRTIKPVVFMRMLSNLLYEHRFGPFYINPVVAGLDAQTGEPFVASSDLIGATTNPVDFVTGGTAEEMMLGVCEAYWKPDMNETELFEATAQALLAGLDRDASSGQGAVVYTITKEKVNIKKIRARLD